MNRNSEILKLKIILLGESAVGKTSILLQYISEHNRLTYGEAPGITRKSLSEHVQPTIGFDFKHITTFIGNAQIKIELWDTAGQERYRSLLSQYYRNASAAIFVFDVTNLKSFNDINDYWLPEFMKTSTNNNFIVKFLIGNKCDLKDDVIVHYEKANFFAKQHGMIYLETSKFFEGTISNAFDNVIQVLYQIYHKPSIDLTMNNNFYGINDSQNDNDLRSSVRTPINLRKNSQVLNNYIDNVFKNDFQDSDTIENKKLREYISTLKYANTEYRSQMSSTTTTSKKDDDCDYLSITNSKTTNVVVTLSSVPSPKKKSFCFFF